jgi:hypothetical protein
MGTSDVAIEDMDTESAVAVTSNLSPFLLLKLQPLVHKGPKEQGLAF